MESIALNLHCVKNALSLVGDDSTDTSSSIMSLDDPTTTLHDFCVSVHPILEDTSCHDQIILRPQLFDLFLEKVSDTLLPEIAALSDIFTEFAEVESDSSNPPPKIAAAALNLHRVYILVRWVCSVAEAWLRCFRHLSPKQSEAVALSDAASLKLQERILSLSSLSYNTIDRVIDVFCTCGIYAQSVAAFKTSKSIQCRFHPDGDNSAVRVPDLWCNICREVASFLDCSIPARTWNDCAIFARTWNRRDDFTYNLLYANAWESSLMSEPRQSNFWSTMHEGIVVLPSETVRTTYFGSSACASTLTGIRPVSQLLANSAIRAQWSRSKDVVYGALSWMFHRTDRRFSQFVLSLLTDKNHNCTEMGHAIAADENAMKLILSTMVRCDFEGLSFQQSVASIFQSPALFFTADVAQIPLEADASVDNLRQPTPRSLAFLNNQLGTFHDPLNPSLTAVCSSVPLMCFLRSHRDDIGVQTIRLLLDLGADANGIPADYGGANDSRTPFFETSVMVAASQYRGQETIELLIDRGADLTKYKDCFGRSSLDFLLERRETYADVKLLRYLYQKVPNNFYITCERLYRQSDEDYFDFWEFYRDEVVGSPGCSIEDLRKVKDRIREDSADTEMLWEIVDIITNKIQKEIIEVATNKIQKMEGKGSETKQQQPCDHSRRRQRRQESDDDDS